MGQALDQNGNVLGDAFGETKREVFDKLMKEHPGADEIRIKSRIEAAERQAASIESDAAPRERMLQFFTYTHLPPHLGQVSAPFCQLAEQMVATLPSNPERTVALRKLLEAKDCAVRALLFKA